MFNTPFPLHPAQYEIYVDQLLNPGSPQYNIGFYIKLKGCLNKKKFIQAINSSPQVFDVFKTRFDLNDLNPVSYCDESYHILDVTEMDFSDRTSPEIEANSWMQEQFNTPFT